MWVQDRARPNVADAVTFSVAVRGCVRPGLGQQLLLAGSEGKIPLNLVSTVPLTNLAMTLIAPPGRLSDFRIEAVAAELCSSTVATLGNETYRLELLACFGRTLFGTQQVAWLHFKIPSGASSAFLPLGLVDIAGHQEDGSPIANFAPQTGRVIVVGPEPLLEAVLSSNAPPGLLVYAEPGTTNVLQMKSYLDPGIPWLNGPIIRMPSNSPLYQVEPPVHPNGPLFIRGRRQ